MAQPQRKIMRTAVQFVCHKLRLGAAGTGPAATIGCGDESSMWMTDSSLTSNVGRLAKAETKLDGSTMITVPLASADEVRIGMSNFGPAQIFSAAACGAAAMSTGATPAPAAVKAAMSCLTSPTSALTPPPVVAVS